MDHDIPRVLIKPMTRNHVGFALGQTSREGWTGSPLWFEALMDLDPAGCFVAELKDEPIGLVTTICYGETGWIGNLIVVPSHRHRGLGSHLIQSALKHIQSRGIVTLRLDADPPGINIYHRLGFVDEFESRRFRLKAASTSLPTTARPMKASDLPAAAAFDRERFGEDRSEWLSRLYAGCLGVFILESREGVDGYLMLVETSGGVQLGPYVARNDEAALDLLGAALPALDGRVVTVGVPAPNRRGARMFQTLGFEPTASSYRMVRGPRERRGVPGSIFGIATGATG